MADESSAKPLNRARYWVFSFVFGVPLVTFLAWWFFLRSVDTSIPVTLDTSIPVTFDGSSDQLQRTVIVPTLDTPIPEGKNVIWCASFQLAWNKLRDDIAKGAIQLDQNQEIADRLNIASTTETDLPDGASYSAAGFDKDGIHETISKDMERLFPGTPVTLPEHHPQGVTAYGYLRTGVRFTRPYLEHQKGIVFLNGANVGGFGIAHEHEGAYSKLRDQIDVLYMESPDDDARHVPTIYALDLCKDSRPNQIVLACLPRGATLADTLIDHQKLMNTKPRENYWEDRRFRRDDELRVPNMHWKTKHDFAELLHRSFLNDPINGLWIDTAVQYIEFNLDRSGAELWSESAVHAKGGPREFFFDKPFLLYIKKRDVERPLFVMWVANDELLQRK